MSEDAFWPLPSAVLPVPPEFSIGALRADLEVLKLYADIEAFERAAGGSTP